MDIYELMAAYRESEERSCRIVAAIMGNLNDRRGIKQELQGCDGEVLEEIFETLERIVAEQA